MIRRVMVSGCFDGLHSGHVCFLQKAAEFGHLYVVVGTDENVRLLKGHNRPIFPLDERLFMLRSLRCVTDVLAASGNGKLDFLPELVRIRPTIFIVNEDGDSVEKRDKCEFQDVEYRVLLRHEYSRYPHRSTTQIYQ